MGTTSWVISDPHFGHKAVLAASNPVRGGRPYATVEEHDEALIALWNERVRPGDRVYVCGDVAMNKRNLKTIERCHGRKVLIKGNHDTEKLNHYRALFDDVRACRVFDQTPIPLILTHIPIHPMSVLRWGINVHGHTHEKQVRNPDGSLDHRYFNVCPEVVGMAPLSLEEIQYSLRQRGLPSTVETLIAMRTQKRHVGSI